MEKDSSVSDPMEEVRKLQELVRKLEIQNQQLRDNQSDDNHLENINGSAANNIITLSTDDEDSNRKNQQLADKIELKKDEPLEDVGLINIEDIDVAEEDSWLYRSPKGINLEDQAFNPYKWLRKDVEDPQNKELQLARRALVYKLDELAILNPSNKPQNIFGPSEHGNLLYSKPPLGRIIDSRTFTRGKKKRSPYDDSHSMAIMESIGGEYEDESQVVVSSSPTPRVPPMTDVIDVQEIARMQEESLRQSSPSSTPKRSTMGFFQSSRYPNSLKNSDNEGQEGCTLLSTENLGKARPMYSSPSNQFQDSYSNSAHSSPPESLNGSNNSLDKPNDSFHHSLPNLSKGCNGVGTPRSRAQLGKIGGVPPPRSLALNSRLSSMSPARVDRRMGVPSRSVSNLRSASPRRSPTHQSTGLANGIPPSYPIAPVTSTRVTSPRLTSPRVISPNRPRLQPPSAGNSPVKSGLPVPKMSRIPSPKPRSGIPVPSSSRSAASSDNELWSEGCY